MQVRGYRSFSYMRIIGSDAGPRSPLGELTALSRTYNWWRRVAPTKNPHPLSVF